MRLANYLLVIALNMVWIPAEVLGQKPCKGKFSYETRLEGNEVVITVKSKESSQAELVLYSADSRAISRISDARISPRAETELRAPAGSTYFVQVSWDGCTTTLGGVEGITSTQPARK